MRAPLFTQATGAGKGMKALQSRVTHGICDGHQHSRLHVELFNLLPVRMPSSIAGFTASLTSTAAWAVADVARPAMPLARTGLVVSPIRPCKMP